MGESTSCWLIDADRKYKKVQIEISPTTLTAMIEICRDYDQTVCPALRDIQARTDPDNATAPAEIGYYYDYVPELNQPENTDCSFYARDAVGHLDHTRSIYALEKSVCNEQARSIAQIHGLVTDSRTSLAVPAIEKYLFASHPDPRVASAYKSAEISSLASLSLFTGPQLAKGSYLEKLVEEFSISVPVRDLTIKEPQTLRSIAKDVLGAEEYWSVLWELNFESTTDDTSTVPDGTVLKVPAAVMKWNSVGFATSPLYDEGARIKIARDVYEDAAFAELVHRAADAYLRTGHAMDREFYLPVFDMEQEQGMKTLHLLRPR